MDEFPGQIVNMSDSLIQVGFFFRVCFSVLFCCVFSPLHPSASFKETDLPQQPAEREQLIGSAQPGLHLPTFQLDYYY